MKERKSILLLLSLFQESGDITQCIRPGLVRAGLGLFYLALYQVASNFISDAVITSETFYENTFIIRIILLSLWAKISLYKYISCWLLTEGVCTMSGIIITIKRYSINIIYRTIRLV